MHSVKLRYLPFYLHFSRVPESFQRGELEGECRPSSLAVASLILSSLLSCLQSKVYLLVEALFGRFIGTAIQIGEQD